jgi:hypothetical protein
MPLVQGVQGSTDESKPLAHSYGRQGAFRRAAAKKLMVRQLFPRIPDAERRRLESLYPLLG